MSQTTSPSSASPVPTQRPQTELDRIAERYLDAEVALSPISATYMGIAGHDEDVDDFSPVGLQAHADLARATLAELDDVPVVDDVDRITLSAMRERLGLTVEVHEAGLPEMSLNVLASPMQEVRDVFDLMPADSEEHWEVIASRMAKVPTALDQWVESLRLAGSRGDVSPRRQVLACITQCSDLTADDGYFRRFVAPVEDGRAGLSDATATRVRKAVADAAAAYERLGGTLESTLLAKAPADDACGRERYALLSRRFLGATVDLAETYAWGQEELARITADMAATAQQIKDGASVVEAIEFLDADPAYVLHGTDELKSWMQGKADEAIAELGGSHFDIPEQVRRIECMIAPTQTGGIYYTGPSEDFSRPGRMWWSVPKGVTEFGTWRELTTVYHEGVPGHHLQVAQTVVRSETLNRWRRMGCWTSGHGEGWALYAERLMEELGYMEDPGNRLGLLDGQSLRAARVVLDIGVHCGFEAPAEVGGGSWDYDKAWAFLSAHCNMNEGFRRFELDRYLGWPGQAPSYKIGERLWLELREQVQEREGADFDIKRFHRRALDVGSVGLDTLREAILG